MPKQSFSYKGPFLWWRVNYTVGGKKYSVEVRGETTLGAMATLRRAVGSKKMEKMDNFRMKTIGRFFE